MSQSLHTPGPWAWFVNNKTKEVYLATTHSGRIVVMDFARVGFHGAQPRFPVPGSLGGYLSPLFDAHPYILTQADHNGSMDVVHPNARLIAAAPVLLAACEALLDAADRHEWLVQTEHEGSLATALNLGYAAIAAARGEVEP